MVAEESIVPSKNPNIPVNDVRFKDIVTVTESAPRPYVSLPLSAMVTTAPDPERSAREQVSATTALVLP